MYFELRDTENQQLCKLEKETKGILLAISRTEGEVLRNA